MLAAALAGAGLLGVVVSDGADPAAAPSAAAPAALVLEAAPSAPASPDVGTPPAGPAPAVTRPGRAGTATPAPPGRAGERRAPAGSPGTAADVPVVRTGTGRLHVVRGRTERSGRGPLQRYRVQVEGGLGVDAEQFAAEVERVLADGRSWGADRRLSFQRVDRGPVRFTVVLASPRTTDRLCRPLDTAGRYSCGTGQRAVLNSRRWLRGADAYAGRLPAYRTYLVNHEVGHVLGHRHERCPGPGRRAPVMLQQTKGLAGCRPNPWPHP